MKSRFITARDNPLDPYLTLARAYPNYVLDDAMVFSYPDAIYVGFAGLSKRLPLIRSLLEEPSFVRSLAKKKSALHLFVYQSGEFVHFVDQKKTPIEEELENRLLEKVDALKDFGGHLEKDGAFCLDLTSPKIGAHYGVNLLLGDRDGYPEPLLTTPKSAVDELGRGSFRAHASFQVLATRWDARPEENGNPFNRQFYLLEEGKQIFYSADPITNVKKAECHHGVNKTVISYFLKDSLKVERTIFLLPQEEGLPPACEVQSVCIRNTAHRSRKLRIVFTGMFGSSNPDTQMVDVIYSTLIQQSGLLFDEKNHIMACSPVYYPSYCTDLTRFFGLRSPTGYAEEYTSDVAAFLGNGDIAHPENGAHLSNAPSFKGPSFFALATSIDLASRGEAVVDTFTGVVETPEKTAAERQQRFSEALLSLYGKLKSHDDVMACLSQRERDFRDYAAFFQVQSPNPAFDSMANYSLPFQSLYQTFVSRGFAQTQKGYREIGFREVQDLYASLPYLVNVGKNHLAKELLGNWIKNVYKMGYANHNFFFVGKEPGMCSDDQIWLIRAVSEYIQLTGDISFLKESFPMADGGTRKLWDTLKAITTYSGRISVGKHFLPLLDKADWNDCLRIDNDFLDGPSKEKAYRNQLEKEGQAYGAAFESELSESVMNAFLLVAALREIRPLCLLVDDKPYLDECDFLIGRLSDSLNKNAYIKGYFARVLINRQHPLNGHTYIGAPGDGLSAIEGLDKGSIYLNCLSWSIISQVASPEQIRSMIDLADRFLFCPSGYRLCSDHNLLLVGAKEAATEQYFLGDRENGGVFKHATMMFAYACLSAARNPALGDFAPKLYDDAFRMLNLVYPYATLANPLLYKGNPRFCTQYTNSSSEESVGPILSGTATWLSLCIVSFSGLLLEKEGFRLAPLLPKEWGEYRLTVHLQGSVYQINYRKKAGEKALNVDSLMVDGQLLESNALIPFFHDGKIHHLLLNLA